MAELLIKRTSNKTTLLEFLLTFEVLAWDFYEAQDNARTILKALLNTLNNEYDRVFKTGYTWHYYNLICDKKLYYEPISKWKCHCILKREKL